MYSVDGWDEIPREWPVRDVGRTLVVVWECGPLFVEVDPPRWGGLDSRQEFRVRLYLRRGSWPTLPIDFRNGVVLRTLQDSLPTFHDAGFHTWHDLAGELIRRAMRQTALATETIEAMSLEEQVGYLAMYHAEEASL